jgi:hypothetical protein
MIGDQTSPIPARFWTHWLQESVGLAMREAFAAVGPADGPDVRGVPDGILLHLRDTYPTETAWAPQHVGDELRQPRDVRRPLVEVAE